MSTKGQSSPRTVTTGLRQQAWWVMRKHGSFTVASLLATLATGTEKDAEGNLRKYLQALEKAGIVVREAVRQPGTALTSNGSLRYQLKINEGRKAPVWRAHSRTVFDPNTKLEYAIGERDE